MTNGLILVVEDEPDIADIVVAYLERNGFRTARAIDGEAALRQHRSLRPDLILLDVQLPKLDGWQVLNQVRQVSQTPIIMLTAMDQDLDKLFALRTGADDYVVKPFNPAEVVARVRAVLRRTSAASVSAPPALLRVGALEIELDNHNARVRRDENIVELSLTLTEFRILAHLARAPRRIHTRAELLAACLPEGEALERTVDSHISKLRKKLEDAGLTGTPASVRGVGYRLSGTGS
jgi:two-component system response regulator AdeR